MVSMVAFSVVTCLQVFLRMSIFLEQSDALCSPAPDLPGWIFLIAILDLISDANIYPWRYRHLPYWCQLVIESVLAVLVAEFATLWVWCSLETLMWQLTKLTLLTIGISPRLYDDLEYFLLAIVMLPTSIGCLLCATQATGHYNVMYRWYCRIRYGKRKCGRCNRTITDYNGFRCEDDNYCMRRRRR